MTPEIHGGIDFRELAQLGISFDELIDFSSNILPDGPAPGVQLAIQRGDVAGYPDRECLEIRAAIAKRMGVASESIHMGNGCSELIHAIAQDIIGVGDRVLVVGPTFSEYARATRIAGGVVLACDAIERDDFAIPYERIERIFLDHSIRLVWICNPNNPTGQTYSQERLVDWMTRFPNTMFVIDESYIDFAPACPSLVHFDRENVIVLRSMTKAYALAGLRLGYAVVREPWRNRLRDRSVPWSVNALAQVAGVAALHEFEYYQSALQRLTTSKEWLLEQLLPMVKRVIPSETPFFLVKTENATQLRGNLLQKGILVRDCTSFGLESFVRIAVGTQEQNEILLARWRGEVTALWRRRRPTWDLPFRDQLQKLFQMRRDVRRFRTDPLPSGAMRKLIESAALAPSVGLSQPWRFVSVQTAERRSKVIAEFETANEQAAARYDDQTQSEYRKLKLAGLREAPEHIAIFLERDPDQGRGLGRATMPESVSYSVVAAIQNFWLAARAEGIGVGWVSILRPEKMSTILDVPADWELIAYLCVGYPSMEQEDTPELERLGWERRHPVDTFWMER